MFVKNYLDSPDLFRFQLHPYSRTQWVVRLERQASESEEWFQIHKAGPFDLENGRAYGKALKEELTRRAANLHIQLFEDLKEISDEFAYFIENSEELSSWRKVYAEEFRLPRVAANPMGLEIPLRSIPLSDLV